MFYTEEDVFSYIEQEDVKFIRLTFCDLSGRQRNLSIMPHELKRAFSQGISFDASAIAGFGDMVESDLFLFPIPATFSEMPWRPSRGKVVRMFCHIRHPDGRPFHLDSRYLLEDAVKKARAAGISVQFGNIQLTGMVLACVVAMILSLVFYILDKLKLTNDQED